MTRTTTAVAAAAVCGTLAALTALAAPASAFNPTPEPPAQVVPVDGAHWLAGAGLPNPPAQSDTGLVQAVDSVGHTDVARLRLSPYPGGHLTQLGVAAQTPNGINPCWLVGVANPDGSTATLHLTTDSAVLTGESASSDSDIAPFLTWSWSLNLPDGSTVTSIDLEVMTAQAPPLSGVQVAFDHFSVDGSVLR